jgi:hypothetical protein
MTKKRKWWTLLHPGNKLDIDGDNILHLYKTQAQAEQEARHFRKIPMPVQVEINIILEDKK